MNNDFEKKVRMIPLFIAILLTIYLIICYAVIDFAISVFLLFLMIIILNIALWYILCHQIDKNEKEPSFIYTFIEVSYIALMGVMVLMIFFNIISKKYVLDEDEKYHYMIVFGAGVNVDDKKNYIINKRIEKAIEYAKNDSSIKFVLSGSKGENDILEEANYMKDYMVRNGVKEDKILLDLFANNTYENINNSLYIIQQDILKRNIYESFIKRPFNTSKKEFDLGLINIGFISSDFHICRINMMARKNGIKNPYDIIVPTRPFFYLYYYMRENLSMFKAFVLGQLKLF